MIERRNRIHTLAPLAVCTVSLLFLSLSTGMAADGGILIDHQSVEDFSVIPLFWIQRAKETLHIAYQHSSHGSQLVTGMSLLDPFMGQPGIYIFNKGGLNGALDLRDCAISDMYPDLGYYPGWIDATREFLDAPENQQVNVILWSWCALHATEEEIVGEYLPAMAQIEAEYPDVHFVYMTGHADGGGEEGSVHYWNTVIRDYCIQNQTILYDFYHIELFDPDNVYFGHKAVTDNCDYDADGDGRWDSNWALEWQAEHIEGQDWYLCDCSHSQPLNCNQKAKAAWVLFSRLAGWNGCPEIPGDVNGDCQVNIADCQIMMDAWMSKSGDPGWNLICDIAPPGGDGIINQRDFTLLSMNWLQISCLNPSQADFSNNCCVDLADLLIFTESWMSSPADLRWNPKCNLFSGEGNEIIDLDDWALFEKNWLTK